MTLNSMLMLYAELNDAENFTSFFKTSKLPESIDYSLLGSTIIRKFGMYDSIVSDTRQLKWLSDSFFISKYESFVKIVSVLEMEYNPIHNYDRTEKENTTNKGKTSSTEELENSGVDTNENKKTGTNSISENLGGSDKTDSQVTTTKNENVKNGGNITETGQVSAYNEPLNTWSDSGKKTTENATTAETTNNNSDKSNETITYGKTVSTTETPNLTTSETFTHGHKIGTTRGGREEYKSGRESTIKGNIGVKTTQSMVIEELQLRGKSIYDIIATEWAAEMTVPCI